VTAWLDIPWIFSGSSPLGLRLEGTQAWVWSQVVVVTDLDCGTRKRPARFTFRFIVTVARWAVCACCPRNPHGRRHLDSSSFVSWRLSYGLIRRFCVFACLSRIAPRSVVILTRLAVARGITRKDVHPRHLAQRLFAEVDSLLVRLFSKLPAVLRRRVMSGGVARHGEFPFHVLLQRPQPMQQQQVNPDCYRALPTDLFTTVCVLFAAFLVSAWMFCLFGVNTIASTPCGFNAGFRFCIWWFCAEHDPAAKNFWLNKSDHNPVGTCVYGVGCFANTRMLFYTNATWFPSLREKTSASVVPLARHSFDLRIHFEASLQRRWFDLTERN